MHRIILPALAAVSLLLIFLPQPCLSSAPESCPSPSSTDLHAEIQALRSQLSAAREAVAELQSTVTAITGALRQESSGNLFSSWHSTVKEYLTGVIAARERLGTTAAFLNDEAKSLHSEGDSAFSNIWAQAAAAIMLSLQSEVGSLFDVIAPVLQAFPDISQHPTMCGKAHAITAAFSGKTLLIPLPNPRYSLKSAATQPRYKLHPLDLSTDPSFQLMAVAFETCARSSEASICDVSKQIVLDLVENGPFWLKAFLSSERVVSINRLISHLCGEAVPARVAALEQTPPQEGEQGQQELPRAQEPPKADSNNMA